MTISTKTTPSVAHWGVKAFLIICFVWSWGSLVVALLLGKTFTNIVTQFFTMAMVPAIAAIIVRAWITKEGFADAGLRPNFRNKRRYYLIALALPVGFW
jgi:hypothetical protein